MGQKPGIAFVNWLNEPPSGKWLYDTPLSAKNFLEELLVDVQTVHRCLANYGNMQELRAADKDGKLETGFWETYGRLNEKLATFIHAPQMDVDEFYDGNRICWRLKTEEAPMALVARQVRCVLQLIAQGAIMNVRRCQECTKWYFARFSHQEFCSGSCRGKHFAKTEDFKQKRRDYMRRYYRRKKSKN